ncbi:MAG: HAD-IB family phosphatase [Cyclobacteriaceae bacterium]|nr:HAD-IB family phosphatase [Cyclobacteriaceae bacterium]
MVSVVIPVLNEEATVGAVVRYALSHSAVSEVLVIDDKSVDNTVKVAQEAGARVITSTKVGKGVSMREGVMLAKNDVIVFLDGDIDPYPDETIPLLIEPILNDEADFCKATFSRQAGRVTELVAKPLLSILFPDLANFKQPLSGMIAAHKKILNEVKFQDDYGVDIGLLIDVFLAKARIKEIFIGEIENKMKPWQELGKMSKEVSQTILTKALRHPDNLFSLEEAETIQVIRSQMDFALKEKLREFNKAVIFDMDNTLLKGRYIDRCARLYGFTDKLMEIRSSIEDPVSRTKNIATLLKGLTISQLISVADTLPLVDDIIPTVEVLHQRGYLVGIISDSYDFVTTHIKNKIRADFALSNELEFSNSIATGEVKVPSFFFPGERSVCRHTLCKSHAMIKVLDKHAISLSNTIAVGDSSNDLCMIKQAGIGVSFCSTHELLNYSADKVISTPSFTPILEFAN